MKNTDIKGRWAAVTGGSSGIGLEFAHVLAGMGVNLLLISENEAALEEARKSVTARHKVDVYTCTIDLTLPSAPGDVMAFMEEHWIEPYIFINNAGLFSFREVADTPAPRVQAFINLHVRAVTELSRLVAMDMARRGKGGFLLNMSSMSAWMPMPGIALYSATKAYIRVFSRSLHYEMRPHGVSVTVCCPGGIATSLFGLPSKLKRIGVAIGALDTPQRFARNAVRKMLKGRKQYINGWINRLAIVFIGCMPTSVRMMVKHKLLDKGIKR